MPPIDLPPETPQDAFRFDLERPRLVIVTEPGDHPCSISLVCTPAEKRSGLAVGLDCDLFVFVHGSTLNSESNLIVDGIEIDQETPTAHPGVGWSLRVPRKSA